MVGVTGFEPVSPTSRTLSAAPACRQLSWTSCVS